MLEEDECKSIYPLPLYQIEGTLEMFSFPSKPKRGMPPNIQKISYKLLLGLKNPFQKPKIKQGINFKDKETNYVPPKSVSIKIKGSQPKSLLQHSKMTSKKQANEDPFLEC